MTKYIFFISSICKNFFCSVCVTSASLLSRYRKFCASDPNIRPLSLSHQYQQNCPPLSLSYRYIHTYVVHTINCVTSEQVWGDQWIYFTSPEKGLCLCEQETLLQVVLTSSLQTSTSPFKSLLFSFCLALISSQNRPLFFSCFFHHMVKGPCTCTCTCICIYTCTCVYVIYKHTHTRKGLVFIWAVEKLKRQPLRYARARDKHDGFRADWWDE